MSQITVGFTTEGTTDLRLLESIIQKTFEAVAFECEMGIEVVSPILYIKKELGQDFSNQIFNAAKNAFDKGISAFCIHVDADSHSDLVVMSNKINPSFIRISESGDVGLCKNLIAVIPVHMSEAWMLADKQLLKDEIGTDKSDA